MHRLLKKQAYPISTFKKKIGDEIKIVKYLFI
jgi:hypothetical protein